MNKAWETSLTITVLTYFTASLVLYFLQVPDWYLGSILPVCGYWLSTLSIPLVRKVWQQQR